MKPTAYLWNIPDMPIDVQNSRYLYFKDPSCACGDVYKKDVISLYTREDFDELLNLFKIMAVANFDADSRLQTKEERAQLKVEIKKMIARFESDE